MHVLMFIFNPKKLIGSLAILSLLVFPLKGYLWEHIVTMTFSVRISSLWFEILAHIWSRGASNSNDTCDTKKYTVHFSKRQLFCQFPYATD
jgi:hypothetical protein